MLKGIDDLASLVCNAARGWARDDPRDQSFQEDGRRIVDAGARSFTSTSRPPAIVAPNLYQLTCKPIKFDTEIHTYPGDSISTMHIFSMLNDATIFAPDHVTVDVFPFLGVRIARAQARAASRIPRRPSATAEGLAKYEANGAIRPRKSGPSRVARRAFGAGRIFSLSPRSGRLDFVTDGARGLSLPASTTR